MSRTTEEPQRTDSSAADAEWKADPRVGSIVHGADTTDKPVDRSYKAAPLPDVDFPNETTSDGSRGIKGWTGSGKGALDPDAPVGPKN